jgi:hypothetical protein
MGRGGRRHTMITHHDGNQPEHIGEKVLDLAVSRTRAIWPDRFIAAYALGSLAHGGFSIHVSDVDFGFIIADPLDDKDAASVQETSSSIKTSGLPLAERLSVFWGSPNTLAGLSRGGRFPPLDRLDLKRFGRLLAGRDIREQVPQPDLRDLVTVSAEFALRQLSTDEAIGQIKNPALLAGSTLKTLTKRILYPVRFLYTARAGEVGRNEWAVRHFTDAATGPAVALAQAALAWRHAPPVVRDDAMLELIDRGLLPIYRIFLDDYETRLRNYGEQRLVDSFGAWRERLER